jgi:hypothetical protein
MRIQDGLGFSLCAFKIWRELLCFIILAHCDKSDHHDVNKAAPDHILNDIEQIEYK